METKWYISPDIAIADITNFQYKEFVRFIYWKVLSLVDTVDPFVISSPKLFRFHTQIEDINIKIV